MRLLVTLNYMNMEIPSPSNEMPSEFDIAGSDIHVRRIRHGDEQALVQLTDDDAVRRYVPWAKRITDIDSAEKVIDWFENAWQTRETSRYAIEQAGKFAGYVGLWPDTQPGYYEFGYALLPDFRGQGIVTATIQELILLTRETLHAKGVVAYIDNTNTASQTVIARLGLQPTDEFKETNRRYFLNFGD